MQAIRCIYCDQLHAVSRKDMVQRQGRPYYVSECPVTKGVQVQAQDKLVKLP